MQNELRKLAQMVRQLDVKQKEEKLVKCAQAAQALIALTTLRQKIGV